MSSLTNKKAVITGGSRGVGFALAKLLANLGCSITLIARNQEVLKKNIQQLPILSSQQTHTFIAYDLSKLSVDSEESRKSITEACNDSSILVNCAGVTNHSLLPRIDESSIISTINLNLIAPIILTKMCIKPMLKLASKQSKDELKPIVLNISSVLSLTDTLIPGTSVYSASKAGLLGFTHSLAHELKGKVRINSILPGLINETDMGRSANLKGDEPNAIPLADVIEQTLKVIEDNEINGQSIVVDKWGVKSLEVHKR